MGESHMGLHGKIRRLRFLYVDYYESLINLRILKFKAVIDDFMQIINLITHKTENDSIL